MESKIIVEDILLSLEKIKGNMKVLETVLKDYADKNREVEEETKYKKQDEKIYS